MLASTVEPPLIDTHLIRTPSYYRQFALSLGKALHYIFSKFKPLNSCTDTFHGPSVCILKDLTVPLVSHPNEIRDSDPYLTRLDVIVFRDDNTPLQLTFSYSKDPKKLISFK